MQNNLRVVGGAAIALGLAAVLFLALPLAAKPPVAWEPSAIDLGVPPGEELRAEVIAQVGDSLEGASLEVTPSLAPYVTSINPAVLPATTAGSEVVVEIFFTVPPQESFAEIEGTLHVRENRSKPGKGRGRTEAKPLPIALVIGNLLYPPDPGERGDETLEGVDADGDGVRDDIQRYIAFTYPDQPALRAGLHQFSRGLLHALLDSDDPDRSLEHASALSRADECLRALMGTADGIEVGDSALAEYLNTGLRSRAYFEYDNNLGGHAFHIPAIDSLDACEFDTQALGGGA